MSDRLHVEPRHRRQVEAILRKYLPGVEVWAYGSRVNGQCHEASDLDLALRAPGLTPIPAAALRELRRAFSDSNIPILVEARDWARLPEGFRREIARGYVALLDNGQGLTENEGETA